MKKRTILKVFSSFLSSYGPKKINIKEINKTSNRKNVMRILKRENNNNNKLSVCGKNRNFKDIK